MTTVTGTDQQRAWSEKRMPSVEKVSNHVWSVPVACDPFPVRYTLAYLMTNAAGDFVVVDPGWDSPEGRAQLLDAIAAAGLQLDRLVGIVVTHFHPDHVGMAQALSDMTGAWIGMHPLDTLPGVTSAAVTSAIDADRRWLVTCGVPEPMHSTMLLTERSLRAFGGSPQVRMEFADGDGIPLPDRDLRVVWTPGHSAGHLCVVDHDEQLVLTGDHVLPRISPNIGIGFHDGERDSVGEYLRSLETIAEWDAYEVCPAHEWRFAGLAERCRELTEHHQVRSAEVEAVLAATPEASVWQIAEQLTWSRGWANLDSDGVRGALGETLAHVRHLRAMVR
ncbi:MBL fold metallo-hydrolase [Lacisediminihabitans sp. FW035]